MKKTALCILLAALMFVTACSNGVKIVPIESLSPARTSAAVYTPAPTDAEQTATAEPIVVARIEDSGMSIGTRVNPPMGYTRVFQAEDSFGSFMRKYPVKTAGAQVMYYNEEPRGDAAAAAVLDVTLGKKNHEGPAGAMARLIAEYLYDQEEYDLISFTIGRGFDFAFDSWRKGNVLKAEGNKLEWVGGGKDSNSEENFKSYLTTLFVYISMSTLEKDLVRVEDVDSDLIRPGDIFLGENEEGKTMPVMVADVCQNDETGERLMLLVQGGAPAQQLHIVDNPDNSEIAPWFPCGFATELETPDVTVQIEDRYRFDELADEE